MITKVSTLSLCIILSVSLSVYILIRIFSCYLRQTAKFFCEYSYGHLNATLKLTMNVCVNIMLSFRWFFCWKNIIVVSNNQEIWYLLMLSYLLMIFFLTRVSGITRCASARHRKVIGLMLNRGKPGTWFGARINARSLSSSSTATPNRNITGHNLSCFV